MDEFKCISCGEIKESETPCSCPTCGYKMYKMPYDRRDVLTGEIRGFIKHLELNKIEPCDVSYYRLVPAKKSTDDGSEKEYDIIPKKRDDNRFPDFDTIRKYVCSAKKTEGFRENLDNTIENVKKHIHSSFDQNYKTNLDEIVVSIEEWDSVLKEYCDFIGIKDELPEISMPEISLDYSETPNSELTELADALLDELEKLSAKMHRFIKQNNMYGTAYSHKTKVTFKPSENQYAEDLRKCISDVEKINEKKYVVDIFSDGSDELDEMLKVLWNSVYAILYLPVLSKKWLFAFADGTTATDTNVYDITVEKIRERYSRLNSRIDDEEFLRETNEGRLFDYYDKLIELDTFGFLGINKEGLMKIGESENKLNALIGLSAIKTSVKKIKAYALANKDSDLNIHMCFYGNPGTGKTEVARIIAGILYENKILPTNNVVEVDRSGLVSQYFGATAEKTQYVIQDAMGGVLFIDEAYALANNSDTVGITDYGKEAIDTLVKAMEDNRGKFCVIFAGYKNEMMTMLSANPGLRSRIQFELDFPNYSRDELCEITKMTVKNRKYTITDSAMSRILDITDIKRKQPSFANAREIRNIVDQVVMCQSLRSAGPEDREIGIVDVNRYIQDAKINLPISSETGVKKILTGEDELEQLIGLDSVKRMVKKIKAYAKRNKGQEGFNLHMCFYGNPGTGKTEVARILSRILYDAGVLPESKLVETDANGLIGKFVGETAPKTLKKINEAMNGVLFIDEAYSLTVNSSSPSSSGYGEEAIAVLLKEMEDHRGQFCVILAGYMSEMKEMLCANPGFESRIQFTLEFPDYSREELSEIAVEMLKKKHYVIQDDALSLFLDITDYYRSLPNFANARTVRNIIDQVIMNQNLRTEDSDEATDTIIIDDVQDYITDEKIDFSKAGGGKKKIGFV